MADEFKCECCKAVGMRKRMRLVPEGWLYAEVEDFETGAVMVLGICSATCMALFFKPGPGRLTDATRKEA